MNTSRLTCADVDVMLADYVDQTLLDRDVADLKAHLAICPACRELAADAASAVAFMDRSAVVDAPPALINRILFEIGNGPNHTMVKPALWQRLFGKGLQPILQPRFAMGMAMTMLSFGMYVRTDSVHTWASLNPANVYASAEDHAARLWDRGVKQYQSSKLVFEIQSRYQEWAVEEKQQPGEQK